MSRALWRWHGAHAHKGFGGKARFYTGAVRGKAATSACRLPWLQRCVVAAATATVAGIVDAIRLDSGDKSVIFRFTQRPVSSLDCVKP
jgi:hypothetical protein